MNNSPIGVFDSGMGGISVWRELRRSLPDESLIYFGDGKNCPYGEKPDREVLGYIEDAVEELLGRGVKMIVLACNTATMIAIKHLRDRYGIPFVGMEPAVKPASETTETGVIGVLATKAALGSDWFRDLTDKYSGNTKIVTGVGEGFVRAVEECREDDDAAYELARRAIEPMLGAGVDRIVLGCTHYPFMSGQLLKVIGNRNVELIDPAPAIVRRVEWLLDELSLRAEPGHAPSYGFMTSAGDDYLDKLVRRAGTCGMRD